MKLDGPLPGAHVSAHRAGTTVAGVVGDCGGGLQVVPLTLRRKAGARWAAAAHGASGAGSHVVLPVSAAGSYRVVAKLGPLAVTSGTVAAR